MPVILTLSKQSLPSFFFSFHVLFVIFIAFLKAFFFLSHLSVSLSLFLFAFFFHIYFCLSLFHLSALFFFYCQHSFIHYFLLFPFFCFFLHVHTHMYITNRYTVLTSLLHNDAPLYPLRNTAFLCVWKYQTSPSGEIT